MTKKEMSCILARASREEVSALAGHVKKSYQIQLVKPPQKTLVMVKARESVQQSLFYLGEVLATECMVTVDEKRGMAVLAGDDFEKAVDTAIIDGYMNVMKDQKEQGSNEIEEQLRRLSKEQEVLRGRQNAAIMKSKVNFNVMGE